MLLSPLLFERLGWRGVANATPKILLYGGSAFFAACIVYQVWLRVLCMARVLVCPRSRTSDMHTDTWMEGLPVIALLHYPTTVPAAASMLA